MCFQVAPLLLLLLLCSLGPGCSSSASRSDQDGSNLPQDADMSIKSICTDDSSSHLSFVTSVSIRGCPVFVHRLGAIKAGRLVLEPTFCIMEQGALRRPGAHFDLLTNEFYFSFPVNVTDEFLATEAASMLSHLSPKSVSFLEVTSVRLNSSKSLAFTTASFLWGPTEFVGHLRLVCNEFACPSLAMNLGRNHMEAFDSIRLVASMRAAEGCAPVERAFPVTVARAPFLPIESLQRPRSSPLRACSDLQLFRVVQLDNCTAYVHRRRGKRGHFVIEPLLCPTPNFQLLRDFSLGSHYVRLPALIEDASVIAAVRSRIGSASVESMKFMKLWNAGIHVNSRLSQWSFEPLRLSADRRTAELRAYCNTLESCELLITVLRSEPVNFWMGFRWTGTFLLNDECEHRFVHSRFAFRMKDREVVQTEGVDGFLAKLESLGNKTVSRDDRNFVIVLQRNCRKSNFQRLWRDYVSGFGDEHNFWIGLDVMHKLTMTQSATLRVEILLWNETEWFAEYSSFFVGNASTRYAMSYNSMVREKSSLVYDALSRSKGQKFSTRDADNDGYSPKHCSVTWGGSGGWWHQRSCSLANPNGIYYFGETTATTYAVWRFNEGFKALKEFRMMIQV